MVHIYEEQSMLFAISHLLGIDRVVAGLSVDARTNKRTWKRQAALGESRDSVQDIQFAPRHHGLKVVRIWQCLCPGLASSDVLALCCLCCLCLQATGSLDGRVRIYESTDVMNLSVWPLVEEFEASKKDCFAVSWNPNPFDPPMLAVGSQASVKVWEYHHKYQKWQSVVELDGFGDIIHDVAWAPNMGRYDETTSVQPSHITTYRLWSFVFCVEHII
jgi:nucleoporin SEH1